MEEKLKTQIEKTLKLIDKASDDGDHAKMRELALVVESLVMSFVRIEQL